jgi:peptidyl-dipeptidase A
VSSAAAEAVLGPPAAGRLGRCGPWLCALLVACGTAPPRAPSAAPAPTPSERERADAFIREVDAELRRLTVAASLAEWDKSTNITDENEQRAAQAAELLMGFTADAIRRSRVFQGQSDLTPRTARMLELLRRGMLLPAPEVPERRAELAALATRMESLYGRAQFCRPKKGAAAPECLDIDALNEVLQKSRDPRELRAVFRGWHEQAAPLRPLFARYVALANEGARALGYADLGQIWLDRYDMPAADFQAEVERLWSEVQPLYQLLHCHARKRLTARYGAREVGTDGLIPAHLLGNMWAQEWTGLYALLAPFPGRGELDVTEALRRQGYDEVKLVRLGESFFTSLGLPALPETFWQRSLLKKPSDRAVVCHASAWDVTFDNDLRIKMCVRINHEDLITIHHELGHIYYFSQYYQLPLLLQEGANDGFHEAIGDAIALSVTPAYLARVGLMPARDARAEDREQALNQLMFRALDKIAFLPFGKLVDDFRLGVFAGQIPEAEYNAAWWKLRTRYQGVRAPEPPDERGFDPGAKYHVAANVPYTRYFLATILQYQFHRAMCRAAGQSGPLHECSIFGQREVGEKLREMLALGAERPWPDALDVLTGERRMDASALLDYYAPLSEWLGGATRDQHCGFSPP